MGDLTRRGFLWYNGIIRKPYDLRLCTFVDMDVYSLPILTSSNVSANQTTVTVSGYHPQLRLVAASGEPAR